MSEDGLVEHTTEPLTMKSLRDDDAINVEEPLVTFNEPTVVDIVVTGPFSQRENESTNLSLYL